MDSDYEMVMPFWLDTDAYSQRDKQMFVCGVEFEMLRQELMSGIPVVRTISTENESRARMMANRLGRKVELEASGVEGWTYLKTIDVPFTDERTENTDESAQ